MASVDCKSAWESHRKTHLKSISPEKWRHVDLATIRIANDRSMLVRLLAEKSLCSNGSGPGHG